jgi:hypothetical protein
MGIVVRSREQGIEPGSIKGGEFLDSLRGYYLREKTLFRGVK